MTRVLPLVLLIGSNIACEGGVGGLGGISGTDHPCIGSRTDTVWVDDDGVVWVGCGTTTDGTGLYRSPDMGGSWAEVSSFSTFRVSHIHRASDDKLYVAGTDTAGSDRVRAIISETEMELSFESQSQTWNSFHVGSYARTDDGLSVAESLTGSDLAWRDDDGSDWVDGYGWPSDGNSYQVLDMVVHQGEIVGVGSTITQPPSVFTQVEGAGFAMDPISLADFDGELWTVDSDGSGLIAGGVDQGTDVGVVFWNDGDPSSAADWQMLEISEFADGFSWIRGVCRDNDMLVAVGEYSSQGLGLMLVSEDGGDTWSDKTPAGAPTLSQCMILGSDLVVAGADGWFGVL